MCSPLAFLIAALVGASTAGKIDTAKIEQLTGAKGSLNETEGVFKVSFPRTDLHVTAAGVHLTPPMGLTAWASFTRVGKHDAVMGDMVLTEDQVNPAMSAALDNGLTVTALHNHFSWEQPRVMFMHIGGMGDEAKLAAAVGKVFEAMKHQGPRPRDQHRARVQHARPEEDRGGARPERRHGQRRLQGHHRPRDEDGRTPDGQRHGREHLGGVRG
jgi:hypothetical protein